MRLANDWFVCDSRKRRDTTKVSRFVAAPGSGLAHFLGTGLDCQVWSLVGGLGHGGRQGILRYSTFIGIALPALQNRKDLGGREEKNDNTVGILLDGGGPIR